MRETIKNAMIAVVIASLIAGALFGFLYLVTRIARALPQRSSDKSAMIINYSPANDISDIEAVSINYTSNGFKFTVTRDPKTKEVKVARIDGKFWGDIMKVGDTYIRKGGAMKNLTEKEASGVRKEAEATIHNLTQLLENLRWRHNILKQVVKEAQERKSN